MNPEPALGAVAGPEGQTLFLSTDPVTAYGIDATTIETQAATERAELARRLDPGTLKNNVVILVDDGIATGATMRSAIAAVRADSPRRVVVATPVRRWTWWIRCRGLRTRLCVCPPPPSSSRLDDTVSASRSWVMMMSGSSLTWLLQPPLKGPERPDNRIASVR